MCVRKLRLCSEKKLHYTVIFLEIWRGHVQGRRQEKGTFDCIYRPTKEAKTKIYIFVYKIFTNNFLNSYTAILMWCRTLVKWSHYKVKPSQILSLFLIFNSLAMNTILTVFSIHAGNIASNYYTILASLVGTYNSSNISQYRSKTQYYGIITKRTQK